MKHQNVRDILISKTISVIANEGLDKTTTKAIVAGTGITEVYIYRYFADKEDLLAKTFDSLDNELVTVALHNVSVMYKSEMDFEVRCRVFFESVWRFLLGNKEKCLAFMRYYYSQYFKKYSAETHELRYKTLVEKFSDAFHTQSNVWMLLNHILTTMLDFALKVYDGILPDNEDTAEHVYRLVYHSVQPYFKHNGEAVNE